MNDSELNIGDDILLSVLEKKATEKQLYIFDKWIHLNLHNEQSYTKIKLLWEKENVFKNFASIDVDADWLLVKQKVENNKRKKLKIKSLRLAMSIAAVFALSLCISYAYLYNNVVGFGKYIEYASLAQKSVLILPDGTKVSLNKNSKIIYPKHFTQTHRDIELMGEAFFDVKRDITKPFTIKAGDAIIEVLGTSFNVINKNGKVVEVNVKSGKVSLKNKQTKKRIFLTVGEKGILRKNILKHLRNKNKNYDSWNTGVLVFKNTPVAVALRDIEAYYGVKIILNTNKLDDMSFTNTFKNISIYDVMEEMELLFKLSVVKKGNHIYFNDIKY